MTKTTKKISYFETAVSFDTETSSFYYNGKKAASMYVWAMAFETDVVYGRDWESFVETLSQLSTELELDDYKRLIIYVHNLAYEFQFMRKWFKWKEVFAIDERRPVLALTENGIEFRCSLIESGLKLENLAKEAITRHEIKKMVGDLDYKKIRLSNTPITQKEWGYIVNDVLVVSTYIRERIEDLGSITSIEKTKTGYVRSYCRKNCLGGKNWYKYRGLISRLTITPEEYAMLKEAFSGGFTHANANYVNQLLDDVTSFDFSSSYPAVMLLEEFPMSKGKVVDVTDINQLEWHLRNSCCLLTVSLKGLKSKTKYENYLSASKCTKIAKPKINNGRVVEAEEIETTITNIDFEIVRRMYSWDSICIIKMIAYKKARLPKPLAEAILKLYVDKTKLKGDETKLLQYALSKSMLNACYGMMVTDIVREDVTYTTDWKDPYDGMTIEQKLQTIKHNMETDISKYNISKKRFLFYPWGVWVTAYARRNLFTGILNCKEDYIYSDTDSIKIFNADKHFEYINRYNQRMEEKRKAACKYYGWDENALSPEVTEGKDKGKKKPLGDWDYDGHYTHFKTLGAKRYFVTNDKNEYKLTMAGVDKKQAACYIISKGGNNLEKTFSLFSNDLTIPSENSGKNTHSYIDEPVDGVMTDYLGNKQEFHEKTCVHLEGAEYHLSMADAFMAYLEEIQTREF